LIQLLNDNNEIFLITSNEEIDGDTLNVPPNQWNWYSQNTSVCYLTPSERTFRKIQSHVLNLNVELIYINGIFSTFTTVIPLRLAKKLKVPVIIAPHGMLQQGAMSLKSAKKKIYLAFLKKIFIRKDATIHWHATDNQEVLDIQQRIGSVKIYQAGNVPSFDDVQLTFPPIQKTPLRLVTVSLIVPKKNLLFLLEVLSKIRVPVIYDIYGPSVDPTYSNKIQEEINKLPSNIDVHIRDAVHPTELNQTLSLYHFFVLPTLGENFGNVIFEAFNVGLPVVISDQTPWRSLQEKSAGWDLPLVQDHWIQTIQQLSTMSQEEYKRCSSGARKVAEKYMLKIDLKKQYLDMFESILANAE